MAHVVSGGDEPDGGQVVVAATFKILVLGNTDVGKSSLIQLYTTGEFTKRLLPTVGIDFKDINVSVRGTQVRLRIWDTAGQERFFTFTKQFFRGAQGILLVFDVTNMDSFQTLLKWMQAIRDVGLDRISIVIAGNKADLGDRREVPGEIAAKLANRQGYEYVETSAVTGWHVKKAFYKLAESLIHSHGIFQPGQEAYALQRRMNTSGSSVGSDADPGSKDSDLDVSFRLEENHRSSRKCCKS